MRIFVSWVLGLVGIAAAVYGVFKPWFEEHTGASLSLTDLFGPGRPEPSSVVTSMLVPIGLGAVLALVGLVVARGLISFGGFLVLLAVVVWAVQARGDVDITEIGAGVWNAGFAGLLIIAAGFLRPSR